MSRRIATLAVVAVLVLVGYAVFTAVDKTVVHQARPQGCTARVDGDIVFLTTSQAENASLIASVAARRGLPARAVSIALTAAYQESKIQNLDYGDSDSLGIFQQRPSQGWGSPRQIMNPTYATNAYYDALVQVDGYASMNIGDAVQEVQRSAFPTAYSAHEADGRVVASALTGYSHAALSCVVDAQSWPKQKMMRNGLTQRANAVRRTIRSAYGPLPLGGFAPGGVSTGHMAGSAHYEGRAIDVFFRPITTHDQTRGWALAQYLVANAG